MDTMLSVAVAVIGSILLVAWAVAICCHEGNWAAAAEEEPRILLPAHGQTVAVPIMRSYALKPLRREEKKKSVASTTFRFKSSCAICLEDYESDDECTRFEKCSHAYHKACIDPWLSRDHHCPLCRGSVLHADSVRAVPVPNHLDQVV